MCDKHRFTLLATESQIGKVIVIPEFPALKITLISVDNTLCPSHYNKQVRCVWAGNLKVTLSVNDTVITLTDNDAKGDRKKKIGMYDFLGEGVYVKNQSRDLTYLVFSICRNPESFDETRRYNLGQPFIIELEETPGTGYTWNLELPAEITLIHDTFSTSCGEDKVGCGGLRSFVLKGTSRDTFVIRATYARPWEKDKVQVPGNDIKTYQVMIV
jgi:predicted secreted protein